MYAVYGEPGDLRLPSDGPMPIAKEPVTITDILIGSLHRKPEFGVDTEIQHRHRDRELARCDLLPDPSGLGNVAPKTPSCPSGSRSGFRKGEAALRRTYVSANIAVLYCRAVLCQVGPMCQTPLSTQTPLGILTSLKCFGFCFFFLFT